MYKRQVLSMRHINKTFPGVKALSDAQLTLREGEIHALMGENGAGKSTLIKVLTGVEEFETGEIIMDGKSIINTSPQEAGNNGISTVYQEVNLCPNLTVAENIFIGREPVSYTHLDVYKRQPICWIKQKMRRLIPIFLTKYLQGKKVQRSLQMKKMWNPAIFVNIEKVNYQIKVNRSLCHRLLDIFHKLSDR